MLLQGRSPYFLIAPLSALINASLMTSVIGDRASHPIWLRQLTLWQKELQDSAYKNVAGAWWNLQQDLANSG
jgi:hypothetical protein